MSPLKEKKQDRWRSITISDVAEKAGVSKATVSLVLNSKPSPIKISETTRQIVLKAAKELNYSPNRLARAFSTSRANVLGVVTSSASDLFKSDYSARVFKGIAQAAHNAQYNLMIFDDEIIANADVAQSYASLIRSRHVDGIIIIVPDKPNPAMAHRAQELQEQGMPFIFLWRRPVDVQGPTIQVNNRLGVQLATDYLLSLGHRRIAVITHGHQSQSSKERLSAFESVLKNNGIPFQQDLIWHDEFHPADDHRIVDEILSLPQTPTAIFAFYDPVAVNVINILANKGMPVPEEISVMGFGDLYAETYTRPSLTSVHEPVEQIGHMAVRMLFQRFSQAESTADNENIVIDPSLVIRASCCAVRGSAN